MGVSMQNSDLNSNQKENVDTIGKDSLGQNKNKSKNDGKILEQYIDAFKNSEPENYERVPDILDYLTYIAEKIDKKTEKKIYERKRLLPADKELYRIIKRAAVKGGCWKTCKTLAWEMNCSVGLIVKSKKNLSQAFEQLDGKPLIYIEERMIYTKDTEGKNINKRPNHFISLLPTIWNYNNAFMGIYREIDYKKEYKTGVLTEREAMLAIEILGQKPIVHKLGHVHHMNEPGGARSPHEHAQGGARSPGELSHTNHNHTEYDCSYSRPGGHDDDRSRIEIYEMMDRLGIFKQEQKRLIIEKGWDYIERKVFIFKGLNKHNIKNPGAYLVKMIEEK